MAVIETWLRQDLKAMVNVRSLQGQVFSLDNGGNLIGVKVTRDGEPVALEGTIAGYCILPDGETINITPASGNTGIQNGNEAYVILPQLAYSVPGQISIVIKLAQGSSVTTLAACTGYVYKSRTSDEVVPPGTPIPDLQTLEEAISNANAATSRANTAAAAAENVDASMSKSGDVITITVTDREGVATTETLSDQSEAVEELQNAIVTKAEQNGYYPDMTVGTAEQLASDEGVTDTELYLYRKSGGGVEVGSREKLEKIVGGTVAWNQLVQNGDFASKAKWNVTECSYEVANGIATITSLGAGNAFQFFQYMPAPIGHTCLLSVDVKPSKTTLMYLRYGSARNSKVCNLTADAWTTVTFITPADQNPGEYNLYHPESFVNGDTLQVKNSCFFDLTAMFGSTIADYIYSLERANPGAGVAWFRKLFPADYYPYNAGELISVSGLSEHKMVGFNQWDEEWELGGLTWLTGEPLSANDRIRSKHFCKCLPNTECYIKTPSDRTSIFWYDASGNFISYVTQNNTIVVSPSNAYNFKILVIGATTYNHNICINFSDSSHNGEYVPYEKHSYPLDSSLTLRGIPKLDSENKLYYDGDEYAPDGKVMRRYGVVDLGTMTWEVLSTSVFYTRGLDYIIGLNPRVICQKYAFIGRKSSNAEITANITVGLMTKQNTPNGNTINIYDPAYSDAAAFKAAMSGVMLVYELATQTTEQSVPYNPIQVVDPYGTEEFVLTSIVPVGHSTKYLEDHVKKLEDTVHKLNDNVITESVGPAPIVSFEDGADGMPLRSLSVAVEPVQDLHGYDHPWPAGGGVNLLPKLIAGTYQANGGKIVVDENGLATMSGTTTAAGNVATIPLEKPLVIADRWYYQLHNSVVNRSVGATFESSSHDVVSSPAFDSVNYILQIPADGVGKTINQVRFWIPSGVELSGTFQLMITVDSTAVPYTPYSNICPISGWTSAKVTRTGKNLLYAGFKSETKNGLTFTLNDDGSVTVNGTATATVTYSHYTGALCKNIFRAGETYTLSGGSVFENTTVGYIQVVCIGTETGSTISIVSAISTGTNMTYTFAEDATLDGIYISFRNGQTFNNVTVKPQLELGSTATAYEPYQGETYEVTFPTEAGTVYGGTLDVTSGVLTVDRATTIYNSSVLFIDHTSTRWYLNGLPSGINVEQRASSISNWAQYADSYAYGAIFFFGSAGLYINRLTEDETMEEFTARLTNSPLTVCYPINPVEYTLTPQEILTLLGINNIWADTGDTTVTYPADTKMYIDNKITQAIAAALNA